MSARYADDSIEALATRRVHGRNAALPIASDHSQGVNIFAARRSPFIQGDNAVARRDRRGQCRSAGMRSVFRGGAITDQFEYIAATLVDRRDDDVRIVVQQRDYLLRRGVGNTREAAQITEPNDGIDFFRDAAENPSAQHAPTGVAAEVSLHQRSGHARERHRFDREREIGHQALKRCDLVIAEPTRHLRRP